MDVPAARLDVGATLGAEPGDAWNCDGWPRGGESTGRYRTMTVANSYSGAHCISPLGAGLARGSFNVGADDVTMDGAVRIGDLVAGEAVEVNGGKGLFALSNGMASSRHPCTWP